MYLDPQVWLDPPVMAPIVLPTIQSAIKAEQLFDNETLTRFVESIKLQSAQMGRQERCKTVVVQKLSLSFPGVELGQL